MFWLSVFGDGLLSAVGVAVMLVQLGCIVHVLKSGRPYWWCWVIFGFPFVGAAAYVFFEVRPKWGRVNWESFLWRLKSAEERIRIRRENLQESATIKNRLRLADELHHAGRHDEACEVLSEGRRGPFAKDAELMLRLATSHLEAGRPEKAWQLLEEIIPERSSDFAFHFKLTRARTLHALGKTADAEKLFAELMALKRSEAPRYYYARLLLDSQRREEGLSLLKDILLRYRRGTPVWRYQEETWFYASKHLLKTAAA
jgi:hypothetical protein